MNETKQYLHGGSRRICGSACFRFGITGLLASALLLLAGCSKDLDEMPGGSTDGEPIEITLFPEAMGDVAMDTRAVNGVDENAVKNLWIIQLNSDGTAQLQEPQYFTTLTGSGTSYSVKAKIKAAASRIYFIANTGSNTLFYGATTTAAVESRTMSVAKEVSLAPFNVLPMSGYFSGTPTAANLQNITLTRAVAKVTFKLAADIVEGCSFELTSVKICNVPKVLYPYRDPSKLDPGTTAVNCYPSTTVRFFDEFADLTPSDKTLSATAKDCGWCYLPENGRGTGSATDRKDKTAATALGGATGQGNYATYIEITGDYTTDLGNKYTGTKYRIYLGADDISNYDVKRNTHYTVTATIKSMYEVDARITIGTETLNPSPDFYDYTDNQTGWFVYVLTNTQASSFAQATTQCPAGYRLPTEDELELLCIIQSAVDRTFIQTSRRYFVTPYRGSAYKLLEVKKNTSPVYYYYDPYNSSSGSGYSLCIRRLDF